MTCSLDGSVRIWKLNGKTLFGRLICHEVLRVRNERGVRTACTAASFDKSGKFVALGTNTGSVQMFETSQFFTNRAAGSCFSAHGPTAIVTSVAFSNSGNFFATRGDDGKISIFETAKFKTSGKGAKPFRTFEGVDTSYETCNLAFSPDDSTIVAGTCVNPKTSDHSYLKFFRVKDFSTNDPFAAIITGAGISTVCVAWPPKINQIICGLSDGSCKVLYDPNLSSKGALLSAGRKPRKVNALDALLLSRADNVTGEILTPNALPLFKDEEKEGIGTGRIP